MDRDEFDLDRMTVFRKGGARTASGDPVGSGLHPLPDHRDLWCRYEVTVNVEQPVDGVGQYKTDNLETADRLHFPFHLRDTGDERIDVRSGDTVLVVTAMGVRRWCSVFGDPMISEVIPRQTVLVGPLAAPPAGLSDYR